MITLVITISRTDLTGLALAVVLGFLVMVLPGYGLGWWLGLLGFRQRNPGERWGTATLLGVSLVPVLLFLPYRWFSISAMWIVLGGLVILGMAALFREKRPIPRWGEVSTASKLAVSLWLVIGTTMMIDVWYGDNIYPSAAIIDQSFRSQVIASLAHADHLPPVSYFYRPGEPVAMRYHYLLFVPGAAMERLGRVIAGPTVFGPNIALMSLSLWVGLSLVALVPLLLKIFEPFPFSKRAVHIGWLLLAVGGLDVLPVMGEIVRRCLSGEETRIPFPDVEWWNGWGQAFGWVDTAVWQPHHLAALIAGVTGCLLLWNARTASGAKRCVHAVTAGVAFATAGGSSVYVTFVFMLFLLLVLLELALNAPKQATPVLVSGLIAMVLLMPLIRDMAGGHGEALPFGISVRPFQPLSTILMHAGITSAWVWNIGALLCLPLNWLLEFGTYFIAGVWWLHRLRKQGTHDIRSHLLFGLCAVSLVLTTFLWAGTDTSNDFGYRGILAAQFVLLIVAIRFVLTVWPEQIFRSTEGSRALRYASACAIVIGLLTNAANAALIRSIGVSDAGVAFRIQTLRGGKQAERLADIRNAYTWLRGNSAPDAIVQENPMFSFALSLGQYSDRATVAYTDNFNPSFVESSDVRKSKDNFAKVLNDIELIYRDSPNWDRVCTLSKRNHIEYIVIQDNDPIWSNRNSFVWTHTPVFSSRHVKVFHCPE